MSREVSSIIRHVRRQYPDYSLAECTFHLNRPCLTLLNNFNNERFHCLYAYDSVIWRSYSVMKSCDVPDHMHDMMLLHRSLGDEYVLPFASHFRESSGYTVAMFRLRAPLYTPVIIDRGGFKGMMFAMIVLYVAVCFRMGGVTPNIKYLSFVYTPEHPVLCDVGSQNVSKKEIIDGKERFNNKRWIKFLRRKKVMSISRYLKVYYPNYFQKKKKGRRCILNDGDTGLGFDDLTHNLVCGNPYLVDALDKFRQLMPDPKIRDELISLWVNMAKVEK